MEAIDVLAHTFIQNNLIGKLCKLNNMYLNNEMLNFVEVLVHFASQLQFKDLLEGGKLFRVLNTVITSNEQAKDTPKIVKKYLHNLDKIFKKIS